MPQTVLVIHSKTLPNLEHSAKIETVKDLQKFFKTASRFVGNAAKMFPTIANDKSVSISVKRV